MISGNKRSIPVKEGLFIIVSLLSALLITVANNSSTTLFPSLKPATAVVSRPTIINELTVYNKLTRSIETTANYPKDKLKINEFVSELIENRSIEKQYKSFSFTLSDKEFILNGQKQPKVIFEKIKRKYIVASHKHWSWQWDNFSSEDLRQLQTNTVASLLKGAAAPHIPSLQITINS